MRPLKLYFDSLSQPCRALEIFMRITRIPHTIEEIRLSEGAHLTEEFAQINPFKKVPVIDDNGFILRESVAIFRYLCRNYKVDDHWYPQDSKLRARVDEYIEWQHIGARAPCALYVWDKVFTPLMTGAPVSERKLTSSMKRMKDACDNINNIWLKNKKFLAGEMISIADLLGVAELEELALTGYDPRDNRPNLASWMERVRNATNPHYDEVHSRLRRITQTLESKL